MRWARILLAHWAVGVLAGEPHYRLPRAQVLLEGLLIPVLVCSVKYIYKSLEQIIVLKLNYLFELKQSQRFDTSNAPEL
jgi:hypothetical protein